MAESQSYDELSDDQLRAVDSACMEFERALRQAIGVTIESLLPSVPPQIRKTLFRELLAVELEARLNRDEAPTVAEYEVRFPHYSAEILRAFAETEKLVASSHDSVQVLKAGQSISADRLQTEAVITSKERQSSEHESFPVPQETAQKLPRHIGKYRLDKIIGQGAFGIVYRAYDEQLDRVVAFKTPQDSMAVDAQKTKAYLTEAQDVAGLDHPNIIPVYDFGSTDTVACYIVSRFIDGGSLAARLKQGSLSYRDAATLAAETADALHAAHRKGLIHRDVKPGNILIDRDGKAWLTDFGLALHDDNDTRGPKYVGTPAYMSPEQVRGEEHRIDGRSDIFSLGAVLYEMLTGRPPFRASSQAELLKRIVATSPRPPRQYDEKIPRELERICLKALAQRASDRFATAHDMAENLRGFLKELSSQQNEVPRDRLASSSAAAGSGDSHPPTPISDRGPHVGSDPGLRTGSDLIKVVPRGLSSFDGHDADFFLDLLPGPRDRHGVPDIIRFWQQRIEAKSSDSTFCVGLIYGPSGCGKTSLMKAGLIPRLSAEITVIYVEATGTETEKLLLRRLHSEYPELPKSPGLAETLIALRRDAVDCAGPKLLIVLDQFEQWLHANRTAENTELVQALRQCDGAHLQCIVMVRDDFWLAVSRFLQDVEIDPIPGRNVALVDLFSIDHAKSVLAAFGRAFGKLPESASQVSKDQKAFLNEAVRGLAEDGKVVPVRLSLFAEMMKHKTWTQATLKETGGAVGVGVAFLEDAFSSAMAFPKHRLHQVAARRVLESLLPELGTDIKGHRKSTDELSAASGYVDHPRDFDELIKILDSELRLITPTELEAGSGWRVAGQHSGPNGESLVTTNGRKTGAANDCETLSGTGSLATGNGSGGRVLLSNEGLSTGRTVRADQPDSASGIIDSGEHRGRTGPQPHEGVSATSEHSKGVADGTGDASSAEPENRIHRRNEGGSTSGNSRSNQPNDIRPPESTGETVVEAGGAGGWWRVTGIKRETGIPSPLSSPATRHPTPATHLPSPATHHPPRFYQLTHDYLVPSLRDWLTQKQHETRRGRAELLLAERFALWHRKPDNRFLPSAWESLKILLLTDRSRQTPTQRQMLRQARRVHGWRWGIGLVMALVIGIASMQWASSVRYSNLIDRMHTAVDTVANSNGAVLPIAIENLDVYPVDVVVAHLETLFAESNESQKLALAYALARYGKVDIDFLVNAIDKAPSAEVDNLASALGQSQSDAVAALRRAADECSSQKDWVRKQRLAVVALHMGETSIASDMCQVRSDRIQRLDFILAWTALHGDAQKLAEFAGEMRDPALQSGLLTGLGVVRPEELTAASKQTWQPILTDWFQHADDAAVHSAAEWLLNRWELEVPSLAASNAPVDSHSWQITKNGLSLVRIPAGKFQRRYGPMARVEADPEFLTAPLQTVTLTHPILMSDREVTVRQFQQMMDDVTYDGNEKAVRWKGADPVSSPTPDHPVQNVTWNDAVRFCNWLSHTEGLTPAYVRTGKIWTMPSAGSRSGDFEEWRLVDGTSGYRLPTNAEWEYACRAGSETQDPFGDKVNTRFLETFAKTQNRVVLITGIEFNAEPCGSTPPNAWGLFDMHGNVREWVQDWAEGYPGQFTPNVDAVADPTGPVETDPMLFKQIRDGIFYRTSTALVIDSRFLGFRVVRTIE